jgi:hypothetical protein
MDMRREPLWLLGRLHDAVPGFLRPIEFRAVRTAEELLAASNLAYREFLARQYIRPNAARLCLSLHHALPQTTTFIAVYQRQNIVGTVTLVEDSVLGLPMDEAYKTELDALRRQGRRLAQATLMAVDTNLFGPRVFALSHGKKLLFTLRLLRIMLDYVRSATAVQELVACFHPKHQILYDFLELTPLGGLKAYSRANGHPALARRLDIAQVQRTRRDHPAYRLFFGRAPSARPFAKRLRFSPEALRSLFVLQSPVFASASPTELATIKSAYPRYDFARILEGLPQPAAVPVAPSA